MKQKKGRDYKAFGVIVIAVTVGFSMYACGDGSNNGNVGGENTGINITQLPEFPLGSFPAQSKADAETILEELRISSVWDSIQDEVFEAVFETYENVTDRNYSNFSLPNGFISISSSGTNNKTYTGGFKILSANSKAAYDLYGTGDTDELNRLKEERFGIQFTTGDKANDSWNSYFKVELTRAKAEGGVTISQGSIFAKKYSGSGKETVTTAGTYTEFRVNGTYSDKDQIISAFTTVTSSGSAKIILDVNLEWKYTFNNASSWNIYQFDDIEYDDGTFTETEKISGSMKVYGSNNTLLLNHRIVDWESFDMVEFMVMHEMH